jgi:hypothetical protein
MKARNNYPIFYNQSERVAEVASSHLPTLRPGFDPISGHIEIVVDKVALELGFSASSLSSNCFMCNNHPIIDAVQS